MSSYKGYQVKHACPLVKPCCLLPGTLSLVWLGSALRIGCSITFPGTDVRLTGLELPDPPSSCIWRPTESRASEIISLKLSKFFLSPRLEIPPEGFSGQGLTTLMMSFPHLIFPTRYLKLEFPTLCCVSAVSHLSIPHPPTRQVF